VTGQTEGADAPALELRGVTKAFGGGSVVALDKVDLRVNAGSVHALLGENGAGKTTLMRIAFGLLAPDTGTVRVFGNHVAAHSVRAAARAGIGMVHQHLSLVPELTAAENFALGGRGIFHPREAQHALEALSAAAGLAVPANVAVAELSIVEQQRLEVLKALARGARMLILDEPTAVLAPAEADELLRWIRQFVHRGGSVVLVTHKLREALGVADHVTVLRQGRVAYSATAAESPESSVARAMFPDSTRVEAIAPADLPGDVVAKLESVTVADARGGQRARNVTLEIRRHEILGVAAVEGAGHRELLATLTGLRHPARGIVQLPARIAVVPAERHREAIVPSFSLVENVALRGLGSRRGRMRWAELRERTQSLIERFQIVALSPESPARTLSGGNQQRLVIARELEHAVDLVIADNPTRGLDLRATEFVIDQLREGARTAAVVVHSSDLEEILRIATRVVVMFAGELREVPRDAAAISAAMIGRAA